MGARNKKINECCIKNRDGVILLGKIIAVANQKGGVGKTTTSVNLSASLAVLGKRVLLIDFDPQGNATSGTGIESMDFTIYEVLIEGKNIEDAILKTDFENLEVCPCDIRLAGSEVELVELDKREYRLKDAVSRVKEEYDFIIIDCPPSLSLLTINALCCADSVLIPIQCEYYALEGLTRLTQTIKQIKKGMNPEIQIEGVLLTMFDSRTNLSMMVADEVKKFFPKLVYRSVIPRNVRLSEAPSYGAPITEYDPLSKGGLAYKQLAEEVIEKNGGNHG